MEDAEENKSQLGAMLPQYKPSEIDGHDLLTRLGQHVKGRLQVAARRSANAQSRSRRSRDQGGGGRKEGGPGNEVASGLLLEQGSCQRGTSGHEGQALWLCE